MVSGYFKLPAVVFGGMTEGSGNQEARLQLKSLDMLFFPQTLEADQRAGIGIGSLPLSHEFWSKLLNYIHRIYESKLHP